MNIDISLIAGLLQVLGEQQLRRALTIPYAKLEKQAKKNKDDVAEFVAKRDAWVDATIELAKEWANLDND